MLCSFPLLAKPHYNRPICHSIDQASQDKKSRNFNLSVGSSSYDLNNRPRPIRASISTNQEKFHKHQYHKDLNFYDFSLGKEKPKHDEDGFKKTKSRVLKKIKQPISPGSRLSSFLNSLFTNGKKPKISSNDDNERKLKSANTSTCSSFSRLCLSKDIISSPCGHKNLDIYQQYVGVEDYVHEDHELKFHKNIKVEEEEDDDDDDGASYASSDLFELDIFSSIGSMGLPVYEATNLATNLAINANGD